MSAFVIDDIGLLVTNDPELGEGPLGMVRDAAIVFEDGRVSAVEPIGRCGRCRASTRRTVVLIPGFVDSHTHLVFAGDRSEEFAARMAGAPYGAGGIRVTTEATRAAGADELERLASGSSRRGAARGDHRDRDQVRLRPRRRARAADLRGRSAAHRRGDVPRRPRRAARVRGPRRRLRRAGLRRDARGVRPALPLDRRLLRAWRLRCRPVARRARGGPRCRARACASTATSSGEGPGVQLAVEMGAASVDHCTYLSDADVEALASSETVATFLPATDFSTRQPYPDARRVIDAGANVAIATNLNPGSSYTSSMSFCIALAVRDLKMTADEALHAATPAALTPCGETTSVASARATARTRWCLTHRPTHTSSTGPACRSSRRHSSPANA